MAAWRKLHFGTEVWEWRISKSRHFIVGLVIRAPSRVVTTVAWDDIATPGEVKAYIERNRAALMSKPDKKRKG